jgi:cobalt-zinc-cadmium efflux system membrane fusion protein
MTIHSNRDRSTGLPVYRPTVWLVVATMAAACSSGDAAGRQGGDTAVGPQPRNISVTADQRSRIHLVAVQTTTFHPVVAATGNVAFNGDHSTQVLSPVSGPAVRVIAEPGNVVHKGEELAEVSSPDFAAAVATYRKAETGLRNARRIYVQDSALFKNDALARADLEQAQADLASADADLDAAVEGMRSLGVDDAQIQSVREGKTTHIAAAVRAPIDGTIVEKLIAQGQLLTAGSTPCYTIADLSTMWVLANVYANDLGDVSKGQAVDVFTDNGRPPMAGRVDYIASLADPGTKAVQVRVVVPNTNHALRRDMFVQVQIRSSAEHRGILVPVSAVMRDEDNLPFVFVAGPSNTFARRRVTLGSRIGDSYEIPSGLVNGDQIVAEGALFLQFAETQ